MTRMVNPAGLQLVKSFEGCRLEAYQDGVGIWTIGYGHTNGVKHGDTCSQHQADEWLEQDLITAEDAVSRLVKVPLTDNEFAALVSFTFNLGQGALAHSTLLKKLNAGEHAAVPDQIKLWDHVAGKVCTGITKRRAAEAELWSRA
jgi:lysozyme